MIENLSIWNCKVIREADVALKPLTVIVGPNASGKTTILQALVFLTNLLFERSSPEWDPPPGSLELLRSQRGTSILSLECSGSLREHEFYGGYKYFHNNTPPKTLTKISCDGTIVPVLPLELTTLQRPSHILRLNTDLMAAPSYPRELDLKLPSNGEGLSSILAGIFLEQPERFGNITGQLSKIVPEVKSLSIKRSQVGELVGYQTFFQMRGAADIPASMVSEGTLLTLGLITAMEAQDSPQLVLIDDLERGLHPRALQDLIKQLRSLQEQNPDLQIVATSHSPYLLDFLEPQEILLTSLDSDGYSWVKLLSEHPDFERWKDLMAPGEFWSNVGEGWITQEKKATA